MKVRFVDRYFIGFLVLIFIGFWPSYFSKFFDGSADFTHYFHFHAVAALLWVVLLILQPILIRLRKNRIHAIVGKLSYVLVPLLFISVILLAHHRIDPNAKNIGFEVWIPFKDLFIFTFGYLVAIIFRKSMPIHARGMIVAGMALFEPTLVRVAFNVLEASYPMGYYLGIAPGYTALLILIFLERKEKVGRWVFPIAIALFFLVHFIVISQIEIPFWNSFAKWFVSLPLT